MRWAWCRYLLGTRNRVLTPIREGGPCRLAYRQENRRIRRCPARPSHNLGATMPGAWPWPCSFPCAGRQSRLPRLGSAATLGRGEGGVNRQWLGSIGALRVFFSGVDDVALDVLPANSVTASWLFSGVLQAAAPPVPYGADACRLGTAGSFVAALPVALLLLFDGRDFFGGRRSLYFLKRDGIAIGDFCTWRFGSFRSARSRSSRRLTRPVRASYAEVPEAIFPLVRAPAAADSSGVDRRTRLSVLAAYVFLALVI